MAAVAAVELAVGVVEQAVGVVVDLVVLQHQQPIKF